MKNMILIIVLLVLHASAWADGYYDPSVTHLEQAFFDDIAYATDKLPEQIFLYGGQKLDGFMSDSLFAFSNNGWYKLNPVNASPQARARHCGWVQDGKLYVHGGQGNGFTVFDDLWYYDPATNAWNQQSTTGTPAGRYSHSATLLPDGRVLLLGGKNSSGQELAELWVLETNFTYQPLQSAPYTYSAHNSLLVSDNEMFVVGRSGIMCSYVVSANAWFIFTGNPDLNGHAAATVGKNNAGQTIIYVFGGYNSSGEETDLVWEYNVDTKIWSQIPECMPYPLVDCGCAPESGGRQSTTILLCGGRTGGVATARCVRFYPEGNSPQQNNTAYFHSESKCGCTGLAFCLCLLLWPLLRSHKTNYFRMTEKTSRSHK